MYRLWLISHMSKIITTVFLKIGWFYKKIVAKFFYDIFQTWHFQIFKGAVQSAEEESSKNPKLAYLILQT